MRTLVLWMVAAAACAPARQRTAASHALVVLPPVLPVAIGPAPGEGPFCSSEQRLHGPFTVAGNWGPGGSRIACRAGPSPWFVLLRALHDDGAAMSCVQRERIASLAVEIRVAVGGGVARVRAVQLDPPGADATTCLRLLTRHRTIAAGCVFDLPFQWTVLAPPEEDNPATHREPARNRATILPDHVGRLHEVAEPRRGPDNGLRRSLGPSLRRP